jgi:hypothetical protein
MGKQRNGGGIEVWKYRGMDGNGNGGTAAYGLLKNLADFLLIVYNGKRPARNDKRQTTNYKP